MPMTPTAARRQLDAAATAARNIREALAADIDGIANSKAWSDTHKAELITKARTDAAAALANLKARTDAAAADLAAYRPAAPASPTQDAALNRAANRVGQLLDAGTGLAEVLQLAVKNRDVAMIEAAREAAPVRIHLDSRGRDSDPAQRFAEFTAAADLAMTRALAGTPAGAEATDALLGRAAASLAAHELTAAQAAAEGRTINGLEHAIAGKYAQQEYDHVAAQLTDPNA